MPTLAQNTSKPPAVSIGQFSQAGRKERNDDSYGVMTPEMPLLETKGIAMAIADGMSTSEAGKEASETCVKSFLMDYYATHESWTVKTSVGRVLTAVNRWLYSQGQAQYLSDRGLVTTFAGLILKSGSAHIFHAGDSRIYLLRNGSIQALTRDHRAWLTRDQEVLSRAFGIDPQLNVDYKNIPTFRDDVFIFTTDGIHDYLTNAQIAAFASGSLDDLDQACKDIVAAAYEKGSHDNITCQIVAVEESGIEDQNAHQQKLGSLPFPPDLEPDMILDGFKIITEIHASNRSQVYIAVDQKNGDKVVLKTPSVNYEDDPAYIEMFTREEWIGKRLTSPHVIRVIKPDQKRNFLFYVTEYIEGQTLTQWMADNPKPDIEDVRTIVRQIVKGLRCFHRREMIHQDLKPDNIMIDKEGTVKILDFGSTHVSSLQDSHAPSHLPSLLGTVDYTAPEYHLGTTPTNRADIYSLGVITYQMLTGALPYGKGFENEADVKKLKYIPARELNNAVPYWVDAALRKALAKSVSKRYDLLSAFVTDIRKPNPAFNTDVVPLIKTNPTAFWRYVALGALALNLIQIAVHWHLF